MTNEELAAHLEYIDGIQKAQNLVLRILLRQQPTAMTQARKFLADLEARTTDVGLSPEQFSAMKSTIAQLVAPTSIEK